ncbi:hypothetical protein [Neptuniibacter sp. QD37_11]|uniref:hypothetical protein n=1 Tax=Neptuniibacter sp. QD37_11 TaxID=3398209 RepID=UPI0039F5722B
MKKGLYASAVWMMGLTTLVGCSQAPPVSEPVTYEVTDNVNLQNHINTLLPALSGYTESLESDMSFKSKKLDSQMSQFNLDPRSTRLPADTMASLYNDLKVTSAKFAIAIDMEAEAFGKKLKEVAAKEYEACEALGDTKAIGCHLRIDRKYIVTLEKFNSDPYWLLMRKEAKRIDLMVSAYKDAVHYKQNR